MNASSRSSVSFRRRLPGADARFSRRGVWSITSSRWNWRKLFLPWVRNRIRSDRARLGRPMDSCLGAAPSRGRRRAPGAPRTTRLGKNVGRSRSAARTAWVDFVLRMPLFEALADAGHDLQIFMQPPAFGARSSHAARGEDRDDQAEFPMPASCSSPAALSSADFRKIGAFRQIFW